MKKFKAKSISERTAIKDLANWYVQASEREKNKAYRNLDRLLSRVQFFGPECDAFAEYAPQYFGLEWDDDHDDDSPRHCLGITFDNGHDGLLDIPLIPQCPYKTLGEIIEELEASDAYWNDMDEEADHDRPYIWHENPDRKSWEIDFIFTYR